MDWYIDPEIPEFWHPLIYEFISVVETDIAINNMTPVSNLEFSLRRDFLDINFSGGDRITDSYARLTRNLSKIICRNCGTVRLQDESVSPLLGCGACI